MIVHPVSGEEQYTNSNVVEVPFVYNGEGQPLQQSNPKLDEKMEELQESIQIRQVTMSISNVPQQLSSGMVTISTEIPKLCNFCHVSNSQPLLSVCHCEKSLVHRKCLNRWRLISTDERDFSHCSFCHHSFSSIQSIPIPLTAQLNFIIKIIFFLLFDLLLVLLTWQIAVWLLTIPFIICGYTTQLNQTPPWSYLHNGLHTGWIGYYLSGLIAFFALAGVVAICYGMMQLVRIVIRKLRGKSIFAKEKELYEQHAYSVETYPYFGRDVMESCCFWWCWPFPYYVKPGISTMDCTGVYGLSAFFCLHSCCRPNNALGCNHVFCSTNTNSSEMMNCCDLCRSVDCGSSNCSNCGNCGELNCGGGGDGGAIVIGIIIAVVVVVLVVLVAIGIASCVVFGGYKFYNYEKRRILFLQKQQKVRYNKIMAME